MAIPPHVVQHFHAHHVPSEPQIDLELAETTYRQQVTNAYNWLNFSGLGRSRPSLADIPLEHLFVHLTLVVDKKTFRPMPSNRLRQDTHLEEQGLTQHPLALSQALNKHLLIVGEPGAGKSTLLRWLVVTFAQKRQLEPDRLGPSVDSDRLPLLIELGRLPDHYLKAESQETLNWLKFLPQYICEQMAFTGVPSQLLAFALNEGRCLLVFDGLDEIANQQVRVRLAKSLTELARLSVRNRVIIGSRPVGITIEDVLCTQFQPCQVARFTPGQVHRFFRLWYGLANDAHLSAEQRQEEANILYTKVRATPAIMRLAATPLLSTMLALLWCDEGTLHRVTLYERCCKVLIERRRQLPHENISYELADLDWKEYLHLLAPLAYAIHSQEQRTHATKDELVPVLAHTLQVGGGYCNQQNATRVAKHFLTFLSLHSGLLQNFGDETYGFSHLTFQEYLAARYIAAHNTVDSINLVRTHLYDAWWQEVCVLTIGHLGSEQAGADQASALLLAILRLYRPPWSFLRNASHQTRWLGKYFPRIQLNRRLAWALAREFELAARGYIECTPNGTTPIVAQTLMGQAMHLLQDIFRDKARYKVQKSLLATLGRMTGIDRVVMKIPSMRVVMVIPFLMGFLRASESDCSMLEQLREPEANNPRVERWLQDLRSLDKVQRAVAAQVLGNIGTGREDVAAALLQVLNNEDDDEVRRCIIGSLGDIGVSSEDVMKALFHSLYGNDYVESAAIYSLERLAVSNERTVKPWLRALRHKSEGVRVLAAESLGKLERKKTIPLRRILIALNCCLHDEKSRVRQTALESIHQLLDGQPLP